LPFTVATSLSTRVEPSTSVHAIVPVGEFPPDNTAVSFNVGDEAPSVNEVALGVVTIDGVGNGTT
jgi:hypothetical protein